MVYLYIMGDRVAVAGWQWYRLKERVFAVILAVESILTEQY
jgi:hypothetical protein